MEKKVMKMFFPFLLLNFVTSDLLQDYLVIGTTSQKKFAISEIFN